MVSDQEPRYRFKDPGTGDILGTVFERGGELVVQEGTSGNENELVLQSDGTVRAKQLVGGYLYAGAFAGSDPDARLNNALAAAGDGDVIFLENAEYGDRTITQRLSLRGRSEAGSAGNSTRITGSFVLDSPLIKLRDVRIEGGSVTTDSFNTLTRVTNGDITVTGDQVGVFQGRNVSVTFQSGTSDGIADGLWGGSTVTDNGTNRVGDVI